MRAPGDRVIIKKVDVKTKTNSGIELPEHRQKPQQGNVFACGPDCKTVKVGDNAVFARNAGTEIVYDNETVIIMREADLFFVD